MNERLKALRVQAINYCMDNPTDDDNLRSLSERVAYKFAELVIEETHYVTVVGGVDDLDDVMKHFGVEQ